MSDEKKTAASNFDLSKYLNWIKLPPKYLVPIAIVAGILIFLPPQYIEHFGLSEFVQKFRGYIGIVFLVVSALLLTHAVLWMSGVIGRRINQHRFTKNGAKYLKTLTPREKEILGYYVKNNNRTQYLDLNDGVAAGLVDLHIIYRATNVSKSHTRFAYNIQPWAWTHLKDHPELVLYGVELEQVRQYGQVLSSRTRRSVPV